MSEQAWTKEPWQMLPRTPEAAEYYGSPNYPAGADGIGLGFHSRPPAEVEASQERACVCVNALAGISDPAEFVKRARAVVDAWDLDRAIVADDLLDLRLTELREVLP